MTHPSDRRQFWRAHFQASVKLQTGSVTQQCRLEDISLKGVLLEMPAGVSATEGQQCQLLLDLSSGTAITMSATIVHVENRHVGLRCDSIDLDSITHLRRLVELNAGDAKVFERDLSALLHDQRATG